MGWPEGSEWGATSYTCNREGVSGTMQHFTNGKVYLSSIATVFIPWSDWNWINHYENVKGFSNLGWPRTGKVNESGVERMYFEKGYLEGRWTFMHWGLIFYEDSCEKLTKVQMTELFVERVKFHFDNKIRCSPLGGETVESGVDCRGLALLAIREATKKNSGDFNCDKLGFCDHRKHIPSTGADGLYNNYIPVFPFRRVDFKFTYQSEPRKGGLTVFDWDQVDGINHVNIIIDVDKDGNRTWIYSNADCASGDHLRYVFESKLKNIKSKILNNEELNNEEKIEVTRIHLIQNNNEERKLIEDYIVKKSINANLDQIRKTISYNLFWADEIFEK